MKRKQIVMASALFAGVSLTFLIALSAHTHGNSSELTWSENLIVFAPLDRDYPDIDADALAAIPERMPIEGTDALPSLNLEPEHVDWNPGERIDLEQYIGEEKGGAGYVFAELHSPVERTATLGIGADWWIECWMNGEPFFDTLQAGNPSGRFSILDSRVQVELKEGRNVLAMRFIRGSASASLSIGDETMFAAERRRQAKRYGLNKLPEDFSDRLLFPDREQAIISSGWDIDFPLPEADLSNGGLAGLEPMPERQMYLDDSGSRSVLLDTLNRHFPDDPVKIRLSKYRYPYEDRHLDAIVWTSPPEAGSDPSGHIEVRLKHGDGERLAIHKINALSRSGLFFSIGFPPRLEGSTGALEVVWSDGENEIGRASEPFRVEETADVSRTGRIPVRVINEPGAVLSGAPMTTGVPFPRGALDDETNVRLVDEDGAEVPLQTKVTARWSRFGPVRWLLCDFTAELDGGPRDFYLEYGPDIGRNLKDDMTVRDAQGGFPALEAGRVRVREDGAVEFDAAGDGNFSKVLGAEALRGAFVEHENGKVFTMAPDARHEIEETGSEKTVVRRTGWYRHEPSGEEFCNDVTRFVFHHDSPVVRIFHTWIFTGDGNRDRIANMGWRFPSAHDFESEGFLASFDDGNWLSGTNLVQFDYRKYNLLSENGEAEHAGRTPGVMSGIVGGVRVSFGVKDFWQNFPSELEVEDSGFAFYNWPRRNPPATFERPVSRDDAFRNRFAHEGELLDFRIPQEYTEGEIWRQATGNGRGGETHFAHGKPESANAQGIARTEEIFLYLSAGDEGADEAAKVIQGLNDESLRAVPDPAWMCGSGVFSDTVLHPRDTENFAEEEHYYAMAAEAPTRWVERLGVYGMWLHGDYPTWSLSLPGRTVSTYRTYRGNHHQWPMRWIPYIRSGEPRFFKIAENATRQMVDANFCHYASEEVDQSVGPDHFRRQGRWDRSLLPWVGRWGPHLRSYSVDSDYMWETYYLTGFGRARDVALLFGELTRHDYQMIRPGSVTPGTRLTQSLITSYLDMYQATFNPWFMDAAHSMAKIHRNLYGHEEDAEPYFEWRHGARIFGRDCFRGADYAFYKFTGCQEHRRLAMNRALTRSSLFGPYATNPLRLGAYAWDMTKDEFYRRRLAASLDMLKVEAYDGDIDYLLNGVRPSGHRNVHPGRLRDIPKAMAVVAQGEDRPIPLYGRTWIRPDQRLGAEAYHFSFPDVFVSHHGDGPLELFIDLARHLGRNEGPFGYTIYDSDTELFSGRGHAPQWIEIPIDKGVYRVKVYGRIPYPHDLDMQDDTAMRRFTRQWSRVYFPFSSPDIPEVIRFDSSPEGTRVEGSIHSRSQQQGYWFRVPDDVEEFWIDFTENPGSTTPVNRASVWNPDGKRVWDVSYSRDAQPSRTTVEVSEEQRGNLWRASGGSFTLDPQIPPFFSVRPEEWFDPNL